MQTIQLNLFTGVIIEEVKAETYLKGRVDKATDVKLAEVAYHVTVGDERVHERKIMRGIRTSVDKLRILLAEYVSDDAHVNVDNIISSEVDKERITITFNVSDDFRVANTDSLARLCSKYIADSTLYLWWGTVNATQANYYMGLATEDVSMIIRGFEKGAPKAAEYVYPTSIGVEGSTVMLEDDPKDSATITYTTEGEGAIDDINAKVSNPRILKVIRRNGDFLLKPLASGYCQVKLYSLHNEAVQVRVNVIVGNKKHLQ